jgi:hypothetical protein
MSSVNPYQGDVEGTQYVANIQTPGTPGQITYYPSKPTPDFEKRMRRDKVVGSVVAILGFALVTLGFVMAFAYLGLYQLPILLAAIFAIVFTFLYVGLENPGMIKTARAVPLIGYITIIILYLLLLPLLIGSAMASSMGNVMGDLGSSNGGSGPTTDASQIMGQVIGSMLNIIGLFLLSTMIMLIGLILMRGGAGVLLDSLRMRTDFSPSIIVMNGPAGAQGAQTPPAPAQAAQPQTSSQSGGSPPKNESQVSVPEKTTETPQKPVPKVKDPPQVDIPPPPSD